MPAKKQTKSRTSNSKANKKISAPRWVIAVVLLIVVGTGAFLVYNSFASSGNFSRYLPCYQGKCFYVQENDARGVPSSWRWEWKSVRQNNSCLRSPYRSRLEYNTGAKNTYLCLTSWPQ
jgi:hypothetical protein